MDLYHVDTEIGKFIVDSGEFDIKDKVGDDVYLGVRAKHLEIAEGKSSLEIEADVIKPLGFDTFLYATLGEKQFKVRPQGLLEKDYLDSDGKVALEVIEHIHLFDMETEMSLRKKQNLRQ